MSLFGKLDAANIPTNPFWVEQGEYDGEVTDAGIKTNRDDIRQLFIEYTITDEESAHFKQKLSQYFDLVDPEMTAEMFALLPADDQRKIRRIQATMKRTLCGNDGNERQKGLGQTEDDLNDENWTPDVLKGIKVHFAVNNYGDKNSQSSIRWVNLQD